MVAAMFRTALFSLAVATAVLLGAPSQATAQEPTAANVAPAPPPGGLTQIVSGTDDILALIAAQQFGVASVWKFDIVEQRWLGHIVGAPTFANSLKTLAATDVVVMRAAAAPIPRQSSPTGGGPGPVTSVTAVVRDGEARFLFSVDTELEFRWNQVATREGVLEVGWVVALSLGGKNYEVSGLKFKAPGATEEQGNLQSFLNVAQMDLWELHSGEHATVVSTAAHAASVVQGGLELVLTDPNLVRLLRTERPAELTLSSRGSLQDVQQLTQTVQYLDSGPVAPAANQ
jgi:hypothetical protein